MAQIPPSIIARASDVLADYYTHTDLDGLFMSAKFPGDPPVGNKVRKCQIWLRSGNETLADPLWSFGRLIAEMMDVDPIKRAPPPWLKEADTPEPPAHRDRMQEALGQEGLKYTRGGRIIGHTLAEPSRSLADKLKDHGVAAIEEEYNRAYLAISTDPPAALTAACAILESVCRTYLESRDITPPKLRGLGAVWPETARHLGLSPGSVADDDLRRILQGLYSLADGIAALRTHQGSAHGKGDEEQRKYKIEPRHARLAVHAAHTMALFVMETWEAKT
ncbi:hypothetical protein A3862_04565 [Methylobacterium sp. XJLW]|uniref:abortive infection family protein n=1 Tax=Methylobacterium sp. XJLW TaxID=739141 RepID=UPI000DAAE1FA|nr:abortive infection family protein [Methylobacterium sp. XJLW]AWV14865.1 hypothetical protein A3862_04565 [Methylobacterium sp. XJLW]